MNIQQCPCVSGATRQAALQILGIRSPILAYMGVRDLVLLHYGAEDIMELRQYHPDAEACLSQLWKIMNEPIYAMIEQIGERGAADCWLCQGTGRYDHDNIKVVP